MNSFYECQRYACTISLERKTSKGIRILLDLFFVYKKTVNEMIKTTNNVSHNSICARACVCVCVCVSN